MATTTNSQYIDPAFFSALSNRTARPGALFTQLLTRNIFIQSSFFFMDSLGICLSCADCIDYGTHECADCFLTRNGIDICEIYNA